MIKYEPTVYLDMERAYVYVYELINYFFQCLELETWMNSEIHVGNAIIDKYIK